MPFHTEKIVRVRVNVWGKWVRWVNGCSDLPYGVWLPRENVKGRSAADAGISLVRPEQRIYPPVSHVLPSDVSESLFLALSYKSYLYLTRGFSYENDKLAKSCHWSVAIGLMITSA